MKNHSTSSVSEVNTKKNQSNMHLKFIQHIPIQHSLWTHFGLSVLENAGLNCTWQLSWWHHLIPYHNTAIIGNPCASNIYLYYIHIYQYPKKYKYPRSAKDVLICFGGLGYLGLSNKSPHVPYYLMAINGEHNADI